MHTVVVGAGAVGRAVPGGLGREPAAAGAEELADGGGGVVRRLRAGAMRDKHGEEEPKNERSSCLGGHHIDDLSFVLLLSCSYVCTRWMSGGCAVCLPAVWW